MTRLSSAVHLKLLREHFPAVDSIADRIIQVPADQQPRYLERIESALQGTPRLHLSLQPFAPESNPLRLSFCVESIEGKQRADPWYSLQFMNVDHVDGLFLDDSHQRRKPPEPYPVHRIEQIKSFIEAVIQRQDRLNRLRRKREKLARFQLHGLMARLKQLGKQYRFEFVLRQNERDIHLSVRVERFKWCYHFSFHKSKVEPVMAILPELVSSLRCHIQAKALSRKDFLNHFMFPNHHHVEIAETKEIVKKLKELILILDRMRSIGERYEPTHGHSFQQARYDESEWIGPGK